MPQEIHKPTLNIPQMFTNMTTYLNPMTFLRLPLITSDERSLEDWLIGLKGQTMRILARDPLLLISVIVNGTILLHVLAFLSRRHIPGFGYPHWLPAGRIYGGARFLVDSSTMISEGYKASKGKVFKVPRWQSWVYILSGDELIEDFHRFPDQALSLLESAKHELQVPYTMGASVHDDPYHLPILRHKLTRNLNYLVTQILDEAVPAFDAIIGQHCSPGTIYQCKGLPSITTIVAQTFNRILVGPDLCRDTVYNATSVKFAANVMLTGSIINLFPPCLHPLIGRICSRFSFSFKRAISLIKPLVEERQALMRTGHLTEEEMNSDFLWWFLAAATGEQATAESLAARILVVNSATVHTSSMTLTQALINLALKPEWTVKLRKEADSAFSRFGWSRNMLKELSEMDSFIKESMRLNGLGSMGFPRKAMQTLHFSDGTIIPAGSLVSPALSAHSDPTYYPNPEAFDPTRFMEGTCHDKADIGGMVRTSSHFLPFGHGEHTCPGRFIASNLLKAFMAHILLNYEISLVDSQRPKDFWFGMFRVPNSSFNFIFKRLPEYD